MLLRTVALLLLCMSTGMCATLGSYQTEDQEAATPSTDSNTPDGDSPGDNSIFGQKLLAKILPLDTEGGDHAAHTNDVQTAKEPQANPDKAAEEVLPVETSQSANKTQIQEDDSWSLNSIRNSFQTMHGYFDSLVELVGGRDGVCQYRCKYGEIPQPRPDYQLPEPNGCSSSLMGFQVNSALDVGIPAMTKCCNQMDVCYDTCGMNKYDCDARFRSCLHGICSDLKRSLGFVSKVQACESMADALYNTVWTLGCRPYMNSQRAACVCEGEEKDEL